MHLKILRACLACEIANYKILLTEKSILQFSVSVKKLVSNFQEFCSYDKNFFSQYIIL